MPLPDDFEVIGTITAELTVSTPDPHALVVVRVCDVDPGGTSRNVTEGLALIQADQIESVQIQLDPTAYVFRSGHRVRVHLAAGAHPRVVEGHDAGYTVVMPSLFGTDGAPMTAASTAKALGRVCISKEFTTLRTGVTTPVAGWLRSLSRELHAELGGPGVGALGMCFTGGFALAMMVDDSVAAPVLCQPSAPFAVTPKAREAWLTHFRAGLDEAALTPEQDAKFWGYVTYAAEFMLNAED